MSTQIHAIDGGMFGHALCEEPTGDSTTYERDVTCSDCLDLLESEMDSDLLLRLRRRGWVPTVVPVTTDEPMTVERALADLHRHACADDAHDPACRVLTEAVRQRDVTLADITVGATDREPARPDDLDRLRDRRDAALAAQEGERGRSPGCLPFCNAGLHESDCPNLTRDSCVHAWHDGTDPGPCPGCGYLRPQDPAQGERGAADV